MTTPSFLHHFPSFITSFSYFIMGKIMVIVYNSISCLYIIYNIFLGIFPISKDTWAKTCGENVFFFRMRGLVLLFDQTHTRRDPRLKTLFILWKLIFIIFILITQSHKNTQVFIFFKLVNFVSPFFLCNSEGGHKYWDWEVLEWFQRDKIGRGIYFSGYLMLV